MKYKVGDKVRVRGDLEANSIYSKAIVTDDMLKLRNQIATINKVCSGKYYKLSNDFDNYTWTAEMLRPAEFKIWCETEEELKAVLDEINNEKYFEKHEAEYWHVAPVGIIVEEIKNEHQCVVRQCIYKSCFDEHYDKLIELTPSEFTGIDFSHKSKKIIIEQTKTGATATYGDKTVTAEGEFEDASRQALVEVLCPFKVGDRVRDRRCKNKGIVTKIRISGEVVVHLDDESGDYDMTFKTLELLEPYVEPPCNAKLFCIKDCGRFETGHIYEIKNGVFTDGNPNHTMTVSNIDELNDRFGDRGECYFMEVKGGLDD